MVVGLSLRAVVAGVSDGDSTWARSPAPDLLYRTLLRADSVVAVVRGKPLAGQCCS